MQACIPKDPAVLWNAEFVQAEDLSRQPLTVDNCLRDNRYKSTLLPCPEYLYVNVSVYDVLYISILNYTLCKYS